MVRYFNIINNKKADMDVTMSWIFILIIGGIFFLLAYNIIDNYKENEDRKYELELKQSLRTTLNLVGRTTGVEENSIENSGKLFQSKSVEVKCVADKPTIWIDDGKIVDSQNQFLNNYPVFMTKIKGSKTDDIYLAVESFRMPFKITNMVAVISDKNLIIFDKNSDISKKLLYKFNKGSYRNLNYKTEWSLKTDLTSINTFIKNKNLDSITLVYSKGVLTSDEIITICSNKFNGVDKYIIEVEETNSEGKSGTIRYKCVNEGVVEFNYIDQDGSLGFITMAIFSNPQTFSCSYNQIINTIPNVYDFYIQKTKNLENYAKSNLICSASIITYDGSGKYIGTQQQEKYKQLNNSLSEVKLVVLNNKFNNLVNLTDKLEILTTDFKDLEKFNCPYVY